MWLCTDCPPLCDLGLCLVPVALVDDPTPDPRSQRRDVAASLTGAVYPGPGVPLGTAMVFASLAVRDLTTA